MGLDLKKQKENCETFKDENKVLKKKSEAIQKELKEKTELLEAENTKLNSTRIENESLKQVLSEVL